MGPGAGLPGTVKRWQVDAGITLGALALLLAWDASGLDPVVMRLWGSGAGFPWRDHWFFSGVLHQGGRWLGTLVFVLLLVNALQPLGNTLTRGERWRWLLVSTLTLLLIPLIKQSSLTSCPWDLAEFGGRAQVVSHWRWGVPDGGGGHCFPSGHASTAFGFIGGWFALRQRHPLAARGWLAGVLVLGALFGWAQAVRGAHYPSHTLWTAWICWAFAWAVDAAQRVRSQVSYVRTSAE